MRVRMLCVCASVQTARQAVECAPTDPLLSCLLAKILYQLKLYSGTLCRAWAACPVLFPTCVCVCAHRVCVHV